MTLVETLVTLVSSAVGLLGIAALQFVSLKSSQDAYYRLQATSLAASMLDCVRANRRGFSNDEYSSIKFNATTAGSERARADVKSWQAEIDRSLPGDKNTAAGSLERIRGTNVLIVTVRWGPRTPSASSASNTHVVQVRGEL